MTARNMVLEALRALGRDAHIRNIQEYILLQYNKTLTTNSISSHRVTILGLGVATREYAPLSTTCQNNAIPGLRGRFRTILADPPWQFNAGMLPEAKYRTMSLKDICALPVGDCAMANSHLYLWIPNALVEQGLMVMKAWGFEYRTMLTWVKVRFGTRTHSQVVIDKRGPAGYFKSVTEQVLFGVRGRQRTKPEALRTPNVIEAERRGHSRKPDEIYELVQDCSEPPYLELFARFSHLDDRWTQFGDELALAQPGESSMYYWGNYYLGSNANWRKKARWYAFDKGNKTLQELLKFLLDNWNSQPPQVFSHVVCIGSEGKKFAKSSEVTQVGVVRRDPADGMLKWYEDAKDGVVIGPCDRAPVELIQQEASV